MQYSIKRYDLRKNLISTGLLIVRSEGQTTHLTYADSEITESVSELYHPIVALESLRRVLENKYESIIGCNGCRNDTAYRATGGYGTYIITYEPPGTERVGIFEPTDEIEKLCTVEVHKASYRKWVDSVWPSKP